MRFWCNDAEQDDLLGLVAPQPYSAETVRAWCEVVSCVRVEEEP
jgi:hypothetical protein